VAKAFGQLHDEISQHKRYIIIKDFRRNRSTRRQMCIEDTKGGLLEDAYCCVLDELATSKGAMIQTASCPGSKATLD
jgi:hypothetical protein